MVYIMPALTHGRVVNGFNGGIRKNNAGNANSRVSRGNGSKNSMASGVISSRSRFVRNAIRNRVQCECKKN